ncbi:MAG: DUF998 domain-containing protein [Caldilineaceae bacterium]
MAVSFVTLFVALRPHLRTLVGRIGLACLLIAAVGLSMAGIFTTDPITTPAAEMTTSGMLHNIGATLNLAMTLAAVLLCWQLVRNPAWRGRLRPLLWSTGVAVACSVAFIGLTILLLPSDGQFGPDVKIAWLGRIEIVAYSVWLMVVARQVLRL